MNVWDAYANVAEVRGRTQREASLKREKRYISTKIVDSLSYTNAIVDGIQRDVAIINSDNLDTKFIFSMPNEDIRHGSMVFWKDNYWLVTERDVANEVYTKAKMLQCNHLLKWIDSDGVVHEQWCIVEDGTKYLTGEFEDRNFIVTRGDSRLGMMIAKNEDTVKFNRESRFLIDDDDAEIKSSYILTKPLKVGWQYNGNGVYKFVLTECNSEEFDNHELGIANYYKYFPKPLELENMSDCASNHMPDDVPKKEVWI